MVLCVADPVSGHAGVNGRPPPRPHTPSAALAEWLRPWCGDNNRGVSGDRVEGRVPGPPQPNPVQLWEDKEMKHKQALRETQLLRGLRGSCNKPVTQLLQLFVDGLLTFSLTFSCPSNNL